MKNKTKINDVLKLSFSLLSQKDKEKLFLISIFSFFSSFIELGALFSVFAFISILFNRELIKENFFKFLMEFFNDQAISNLFSNGLYGCFLLL